MSARDYWRQPIARPTHGGCATCPPVTSAFAADHCIAVGFGYAACTKDGVVVLEEPQGDDGDECPTGADAEALAAADPDHDWRIVLYGPLSGRTYQRQGEAGWLLIEQNEGFA